MFHLKMIEYRKKNMMTQEELVRCLQTNDYKMGEGNDSAEFGISD